MPGRRGLSTDQRKSRRAPRDSQLSGHSTASPSNRCTTPRTHTSSRDSGCASPSRRYLTPPTALCRAAANNPLPASACRLAHRDSSLGASATRLLHQFDILVPRGTLAPGDAPATSTTTADVLESTDPSSPSPSLALRPTSPLPPQLPFFRRRLPRDDARSGITTLADCGLRCHDRLCAGSETSRKLVSMSFGGVSLAIVGWDGSPSPIHPQNRGRLMIRETLAARRKQMTRLAFSRENSLKFMVKWGDIVFRVLEFLPWWPVIITDASSSSSSTTKYPLDHQPPWPHDPNPNPSAKVRSITLLAPLE